LNRTIGGLVLLDLDLLFQRLEVVTNASCAFVLFRAHGVVEFLEQSDSAHSSIDVGFLLQWDMPAVVGGTTLGTADKWFEVRLERSVAFGASQQSLAAEQSQRQAAGLAGGQSFSLACSWDLRDGLSGACGFPGAWVTLGSRMVLAEVNRFPLASFEDQIVEDG
jgi:hypothetical protein